MREWQGRKRFFDAPDAQWPPSEESCDSQGTGKPAPPFPPDGFYSNEMCNPASAARLVRSLMTSITRWGDDEFDAPHFFRHFAGPYSDANHPMSVGRDQQFDSLGPAWFYALGLDWDWTPEDINESNYCQVLSRLSELLSKLDTIDISPGSYNDSGVNSPFSVTDWDTSTCCGVDDSSGGPPIFCEIPEIGGCQAAELPEGINNVPPTTTFGFINSAEYGWTGWEPFPCENAWVPENGNCQNTSCFRLVPFNGTLGFRICTAGGGGTIAPSSAGRVESPPFWHANITGENATALNSVRNVLGMRGQGQASFIAAAGSEGLQEWFFPPVAHLGEREVVGSLNLPGGWMRRIGESTRNEKVEQSGDRTMAPHGWKLQSTAPITNPPAFITAMLQPEFETAPDDVVQETSPCTSCGFGTVTYGTTRPQVMISLGSSSIGNNGYVLIRSDSLLGTAEEMLTDIDEIDHDNQVQIVPSTGAPEVADPAKCLTIHGPWVKQIESECNTGAADLFQLIRGRRYKYVAESLGVNGFGICYANIMFDPTPNHEHYTYDHPQLIQTPAGRLWIDSPIQPEDTPPNVRVRQFTVKVYGPTTSTAPGPGSLCGDQPTTCVPIAEQPIKTITIRYTKPIIVSGGPNTVVEASLEVIETSSDGNKTTEYSQKKTFDLDFFDPKPDPLNVDDDNPDDVYQGTIADRLHIASDPLRCPTRVTGGDMPRGPAIDHKYYSPKDEDGDWTVTVSNGTTLPLSTIHETPVAAPIGTDRAEIVTVSVEGGGIDSERRSFKTFGKIERLVEQVVHFNTPDAQVFAWTYDSDGYLLSESGPRNTWRVYTYVNGKLASVETSYMGRPMSSAGQNLNRLETFSSLWVDLVAPNDPWAAAIDTVHTHCVFLEGIEVERTYTIEWASNAGTHGTRLYIDALQVADPFGNPNYAECRETTTVRMATLPQVPDSGLKAFVESQIALGSISSHSITHEVIHNLDPVAAGTRRNVNGRTVARWTSDGRYSYFGDRAYDETNSGNYYGESLQVDGWATASHAVPVGYIPTFSNGAVRFSPTQKTRTLWGKENSSGVLDYQRTYATTPDDTILDFTSQNIVARIIGGFTVAPSDIDIRGRVTKRTSVEGAVDETSYGCCDVDFRIGTNGVKTTYNYDPVTRRLTETTEFANVQGAAINRTYGYDAWGRRTHEYRNGILQSQSHYKDNGELEWTEDAVGNRTTYSEVFDPNTGLITRTTTLPDPDGGGPEVAPQTTEISTSDGYVLSSSGSGTRPVEYEYLITPTGQRKTKEVRIGSAGQTTEWVETTTDALGRTISTKFADGAEELRKYDGAGRMTYSRDADGVVTLMEYGYGIKPIPGQSADPVEWTRTAIDMDGNNSINYTGVDRVSATWNSYVIANMEASGGTGQNPPPSDYPALRSESWTLHGLENDTATWIRNSQSDSLAGGPGVVSLGRKTITRIGPVANEIKSHSTSFTIRSSMQNVQQSTRPDGVMSQTISHNTFNADLGCARWSETAEFAHDGTTVLSATYSGLNSLGLLSKSLDKKVTSSAADDTSVTYTYDSLDRAYQTVVTAFDGSASQTTTSVFDALGRVTQVTLPGGGIVKTKYSPQGDVLKRWGFNTYPVEYTYDSQGRMKTMKTWQDFNEASGNGSNGDATTTWNYSSTRGWLTQKLYQNNTGPSYTYTPAGRLSTRTWARGIVTTYEYTDAGDVKDITYSDTTPPVSFAYDRAGRVTDVNDGVGPRMIQYDEFNRPTFEDFTDGPLLFFQPKTAYDSLGRRSVFQVTQTVDLYSYTSISKSEYGYDANTGRLAWLKKDSHLAQPGTTLGQTAVFGYEQGTGRHKTTTYRHGFDPTTSPVVTTMNRTFDGLGRLTNVFNDGTASTDETFGLQYNSMNQRDRIDLGDGSAWVYTYDSMGQVISGKRRILSNGTPTNPIPGMQFEYTFDDIGNRIQSKLGGDPAGNNLRPITYTRNLLNQYSHRYVPRSVDIMGYSASANVSVSDASGNYSLADYRNGDYFQELVAWPAVGALLQQNVNIEWSGAAPPEETRAVLVPASSELFAHDLDGNMTSDAQWFYYWDAENRLVSVQTRPGLDPSVPKKRVDYIYDYIGRRCVKQVYIWTTSSNAAAPPPPSGDTNVMAMSSSSGSLTEEEDVAGDPEAGEGSQPPPTNVEYPLAGAWEITSTYKFLWDGWNLAMEIDGDDQPIRSYAWGLDLSGSEQGAGGVGGLCFETSYEPSALYPSPEIPPRIKTVSHATYDYNGNLISLRNTTGVNGGFDARYEYGPFGESLTSRDTLAGTNPFRFSTKYTDPETGLLYYGYRYYNAGLGRWMSRDPIGEEGGHALFAFVSNATTTSIDPAGKQRIVLAIEGFWGTSKLSTPFGDIGSSPWVEWNWYPVVSDPDQDNEWHYTSWMFAVEKAASLVAKLKTPVHGNEGDCNEVYPTIVVLGYSYGGSSAIDVVDYLKHQNIRVDLVFTADPIPKTAPIPMPSFFTFDKRSNVTKWVNFYQRDHGSFVTVLPPQQFRGFAVDGAENHKLSGSDFDKSNIRFADDERSDQWHHDRAHYFITGQRQVMRSLRSNISTTPTLRFDWKAK